MSHRNKLSNNEPNHLYVIRDKWNDDIFKYGISSDSINSEGLSKRITDQLRILNLAVGWKRYFANILLKDISGRKKAKGIEREHIRKYEEEFGVKPRGNLTD